MGDGRKAFAEGGHCSVSVDQYSKFLPLFTNIHNSRHPLITAFTIFLYFRPRKPEAGNLDTSSLQGIEGARKTSSANT